MNILLSLFVALIGAAIGAVTVCCFIIPLLALIAVISNGADGYKLDDISDKLNLYNKASAASLMTKLMTFMAAAAACMSFAYCRINTNDSFMFVTAILELILVPAHLVIGAKLKHQSANN